MLTNNPPTVQKGRVTFDLFDDVTPKTATNFRELCSGKNQVGTYKGSSFHRIIPDFMLQGGDFTRGNVRTRTKLALVRTQQAYTLAGNRRQVHLRREVRR